MSSFRTFWKSLADAVQPGAPAPSTSTASQDVGHASADAQLQQKMEARSKSVWQRVGAMASVMPPDVHLKILQLMGAAASARPRDQAQVFAKVEAVLDKHEQAGARLDALRTQFANVMAKMPARVRESVPELLNKAQSAPLGDKTKILDEVEDLISIALNPTEMWSQPSRDFKRLLGRAQDGVNEAIDDDPTLKNDPIGRGVLKGGVELGLGAARFVVDPRGTLGEMASAMKAAYEAEGGGPRGIDSALNVVNPVFQGLVATHKMLEHVEKDDWEGAAKEAVNIAASVAATAGVAKFAAAKGSRLLETPVAAGAESGSAAAGTASGSKPATDGTAPHAETAAPPHGDSPAANAPVSSSGTSPASPAVSHPESSFADLQSTVDEVNKQGLAINEPKPSGSSLKELPEPNQAIETRLPTDPAAAAEQARTWANSGAAKARRQAMNPQKNPTGAGTPQAGDEMAHMSASRHNAKSGIPNEIANNPANIEAMPAEGKNAHVGNQDGTSRDTDFHAAQEGLLDEIQKRNQAGKTPGTVDSSVAAQRALEEAKIKSEYMTRRHLDEVKAGGPAKPEPGPAVDPKTGEVITSEPPKTPNAE